MERIGDVLGEMRRSGRLDKGIKVQTLGEVWPALQSLWGRETVGAYIARNSRPAQFRKGMLTILCTNPSIMQVLDEQKEEIIERLNAHLGSPMVRGLNFGLESREDVQIRRPRPAPAPPAEQDSLKTVVQLTPQQLEQAERFAEKVQNPSLRLAFQRAYEAWLRWSVWKRHQQRNRPPATRH